jgi:predicted nucleic acid-binding protein
VALNSSAARRALDSSVLLRYLLDDDEVQSPLARALIESHTPVGVTAVTLAEAAWVLAGPRLGIERSVVADTLLRFLARENIACVGLDKREAQAALLRCRPATGGADFGDALIAACARSAGLTEIYCFDQRFARAGLAPVVPGDAAE